MNTKQKLAYIAVGGLLVAAGMIISPLNPQKDKIGDIECTGLTVNGTTWHNGSIYVYDGSILLNGSDTSGYMYITRPSEHRPAININDGVLTKVQVGFNKHGGYVKTKDRSKG